MLHKLSLDSSTIYLFPEMPLWFVTDNYGQHVVDYILSNDDLSEIKISKKLSDKGINVSTTYVNEAVSRILKRLLRLLSRNILNFNQYRLNCMVLELTKRCNFTCKHCFAFRSRREANELPIDLISKLLAEARKLGVKHISITGGEPFLRKDIFEVLEFINREGMSVLLLTNGSLISEKIAKQLSSYSKLRVQVSLEGSCPLINDVIRGKGTFRLAVSGIRKLIKEDLCVFLSCTVLKPNLNDFADYIRLGSKLGVQGIRFGTPTVAGRLRLHPELVPTDEELVDYYIAVRDFFKKNKISIKVGELESI